MSDTDPLNPINRQNQPQPNPTCNCWVNEKCCCCIPGCKSSTQTNLYVFWNFLRFVSIGVLVYLANDQHINNEKQLIKDCCSCYYISKAPGNYSDDLNGDTSFGLTNCIPEYITCKYCNETFGSAQAAFDYDANNTAECPYPDYPDPEWELKPTKEVTGCESDILESLTVFFLFYKSYRRNAVSAFLICTVYAFISVVVYFVCGRECYYGMSSIYNIVIAELNLFFLYKGNEYFIKEFVDVGENDRTLECSISSTSQTVRNFRNGAIIVASCIAVIHIFISFLNCCNNCCVCCCSCLKQSGHARADQIEKLNKFNKKYDKNKNIYYKRLKYVFYLELFFFSILFIIGIAIVVGISQMHPIFNFKKMEWQINAVIASVLIILALFDILLSGEARKLFYDNCKKHFGKQSKIQADVSDVTSIRSSNATDLQLSQTQTIKSASL